jgi:hypothetical protein
VEHGIKPDQIVASHRTAGVVDRTRPLCPYPQVARYIGSGSIDDSANFQCELRGLDRADEAADFDHGAQGRARTKQGQERAPRNVQRRRRRGGAGRGGGQPGIAITDGVTEPGGSSPTTVAPSRPPPTSPGWRWS